MSQALLKYGLNLFWTIRYLSVRQIQSRCTKLLKQNFRKIIKSKPSIPKIFERRPLTTIYACLNSLSNDKQWQNEVQKALDTTHSLGKGQFTFLNQTVISDSRQLWSDESLSQLWRYHLHYFNYTIDLAITDAFNNGKVGYGIFRELSNSWVEKNRLLKGDGWHPYTLSLRIVNWIEALSLFENDLKDDPEFENLLLSSIYGQARFLYNNLEFDVRGNHLLKNLKGLIWCSHAFNGQEPNLWFKRAITLLRIELEEQVLSDGGHFERNPGYHAVVLKDCIEINQFLRLNGDCTTYRWLENTIDHMFQYLIAILSQEGKLPLLKDTALDAAPHPGDLLAIGAVFSSRPDFKRSDEFGLYPLLFLGKKGFDIFRHWPVQSDLFIRQDKMPEISAIRLDTPDTKNREAGVISLKHSGLFVLKGENPKTYMVVDVGKNCPDYLPAHAHADLFSYELNIAGKQVVVDSGVYSYSQGKWRDYFRSTRAHNTVEISGNNQSEVWSSFRVARRAKPFDVSIRKGKSSFLIEGNHDGYRRFKPAVVHRRTIIWEIGKFWFIVDEIEGQGVVEANNFIHFAPELRIQQENNSSLKIKGLPQPLWIKPFGSENHRVVKGQKDPIPQGWYSDSFGMKIPNSVLTISKRARLPFQFGYIITQNPDLKVENHLENTKNQQLTVKDNTNTYTFPIYAYRDCKHQ